MESTHCTAALLQLCANTSGLRCVLFFIKFQKREEEGGKKKHPLPPLLGGKQSGANRKHQGYKYFSGVSCQTHLVFRPETSSYG